MAGTSELPVILVGAGLHGRVVRDLCADAGLDVAGFLDDFAEHGTSVDDLIIVGSSDLLDDPSFLKSHRFIVTIGNNIARQAFADRISEQGGALATAIHPNCVLSPTVQVGEGTVLIGANMAFSRAVIGNNVLVDPDATIGAESVIEDAVYICPGVHLGAGVVCREFSFIGLGAVVLPETEIGRKAIVGAGAVVTRNVPDETMVVGNPAKPKGKAVLDDMSPYPARRRGA